MQSYIPSTTGLLRKREPLIAPNDDVDDDGQKTICNIPDHAISFQHLADAVSHVEWNRPVGINRQKLNMWKKRHSTHQG